MNRQYIMRSAAIAVLAGSIVLSGCARVRGHQGFIADQTLISGISPGIDNKQSVEDTLGRPTFTGQFDKNEWYYVSRDTRQFGFNNPSPKEQMVLRVQFDNAGNVIAADKTGLETVVNINPAGDKTPTAGRDRSFFEELFGNIGAVGAGAAPGGADSTRP